MDSAGCEHASHKGGAYHPRARWKAWPNGDGHALRVCAGCSALFLAYAPLDSGEGPRYEWRKPKALAN